MTESKRHGPHDRGGWRLATLLVGVLVVVLLIPRLRSVLEEQQDPPDARFAAGGDRGTLTLTLRVGDEPARRLELALAEPVLLLDAMQEAARRDRAWHAEFEGRGEGAFVAKLAGRTNQGAGGNNWIYHLNGELGEVGIGACTVTAGDDILWKFAPYD